MQRSHLTLGLVALVAALWSTQCTSLSDDCKKTLTCGEDAGAPELNPLDCTWRFPDGGEWKEGPRKVNGMWVWPNGDPAPTFNCAGNGGQGGSGPSDNCSDAPTLQPGQVRCDPRHCEPMSGNCVQCLDSEHCAAQTDAGASAALVCDIATHRCIECLVNRDCADTGRPFCQLSQTDSALNECVSCLRDADCGATEVCDEPTGECTLRCSAAENNCRGDKPVCNLEAGVCVECLDDTTCSGGTSECNTTTKECVQCVTNTPCGPLGRVCNAPANECVRCTADEHCDAEEGTLRCDTAAHACVECLTSDQCLNPAESRCNPGTHTCETCTQNEQCESAAPKCRTSDGQCVACLNDGDCASGRCDIASGRCEACLTDADCPLADAARCDLATHQCAPCDAAGGFAECVGKTTAGLCRVGDGLCVNCLDNPGCVASGAALSRCGGAGNCVVCASDTDCDLFATRRACRTNAINPGCVECVNDGHCIGNDDGPRCKTTATGGSGAINTCVECLTSADCSNPAASFCDEDNKCVACINDGECSHLSNLGVCDTSGGDGVCVQCTGLERGACGANVCDSLTRQCTSFPVGSALNDCATCVSDAHCATGKRCIEQTFQGTDIGFFCFPLQTTGTCPRGFGLLATTNTIDNQTAAACLQRETTCPAFADYSALQACQNEADDAACGVANLADGSCVQSQSSGFVCTISCELTADCLNSACTNTLCPQ